VGRLLAFERAHLGSIAYLLGWLLAFLWLLWVGLKRNDAASSSPVWRHGLSANATAAAAAAEEEIPASRSYNHMRPRR
jgi:hypothetical protein